MGRSEGRTMRREASRGKREGRHIVNVTTARDQPTTPQENEEEEEEEEEGCRKRIYR